MLFKRYESTEVDRRTWLHVPSGTHWSTSSDTHQVVEIQIETSTKLYTPKKWKVLVSSRLPSSTRYCAEAKPRGHIEVEREEAVN